jgi:predicted ATP-dependent Lon-type protease
MATFTKRGERWLAQVRRTVSEAYERVRLFLLTQMRMSHVYQPLMIRRLLLSGGEASRRAIAEEILSRDPTQLEYYELIVRDMVGRVLTAKPDVVRRRG